MPEAIRDVLSFWVGLLAVTILTIAANAGVIGSSRLAYFMSVRQQLPSDLSLVHRRSRVPYRAIILFSVLAALLITVGQVSIMADLYAFGAMLTYTLAHISIIALRIKEPNLPRPFKIRLNMQIYKKDIPITALIGGLGTGITWFIVLYTHHFGRIVGFAWVGVGILIYILYRRITHKPIVDVAVEVRPRVRIVHMKRNVS